MNRDQIIKLMEERRAEKGYNSIGDVIEVAKEVGCTADWVQVIMASPSQGINSHAGQQLNGMF